MALVHVSCPDCGSLSVPSRSMAVVIGAVRQYRFRCTRCETIVLTDTGDDVIARLAAAHAELVDIDLTPDRRPIELPEIVDPDDYCIGVHEAFQQWDPWTLFDATDGLV